MEYYCRADKTQKPVYSVYYYYYSMTGWFQFQSSNNVVHPCCKFVGPSVARSLIGRSSDRDRAHIVNSH